VETALHKKQEFEEAASVVEPLKESIKKDNHDFEFISMYGKELADGEEGATSLRPSSSKANHGRGKGKHSSGNSKPSTKPVRVSSPHQNTSGSSDAAIAHSLIISTRPSLSNTSNSVAVKVKNNTVRGTGIELSTAQEPVGTGKKGYYPPIWPRWTGKMKVCEYTV